MSYSSILEALTQAPENRDNGNPAQCIYSGITDENVVRGLGKATATNLAIWTGAVNPPPGVPAKPGRFLVANPYLGASVERAIQELVTSGDDRRKAEFRVFGNRKNLHQSDIGLVCAYQIEADEGTMVEQATLLDQIADGLNIRWSSACLSGDTRPEYITAAGLDPARISKGKSIHAHGALAAFPTTDTAALADWLIVQKGLVVLTKGDTTFTNLDRLTRLPGGIGYERGKDDGKAPIRLQTVLSTDMHDAPTVSEVRTKVEALVTAWGITQGIQTAFESLQWAFEQTKLATLLENQGHVSEAAQVRAIASEVRNARLVEEKHLDAIRPIRSLVRKTAGTGTKVSNKKGTGSIAFGEVGYDTSFTASDGSSNTIRGWMGHGAKVTGYCPCCEQYGVSKTPSAVLFLDGSAPRVWCSAESTSYRVESDGMDAITLPEGVTPIGALKVEPITEKEDLSNLIDQVMAALPPAPPAKPRYLGALTLVKPITIVRADTGSGKTTITKALVEEYVRQGKRVLVVVHRRSLALSSSNTLGIVNYMDIDGEIKEDAVVVCLDSITRVRLFDENADPLEDDEIRTIPYDLIIIEESESVLEHLHGGTIPITGSGKTQGRRANSGEVYHWLQQHCVATTLKGGHILCLDAFAGELTQKEMIRLTSKTEADVQVVEHLLDLNQTITVQAGLGDLVQQLVADVDAGLRCYVAATSATDSRALWRLFDQRVRPDGVKVDALVYHSEMPGDVRATLRDVEKTWGAFQVVISSPSVDTGVSYDHLHGCKAFDRVYLIARRPKGAGRVPGFGLGKVLQMIDRVRNRTALTAWLDPDWKHGETTDLDLIRKEKIRATARAAKGSKTSLTLTQDGRVGVGAGDKDHLESWCLVERWRRIRSQNLGKSFVGYFQGRAATVTTLDLTGKNETGLDILKQAREDEKLEYGLEIDAADSISEAEADHIRRDEDNLTLTKMRALERRRLIDVLGAAGITLSVADRHREVTRKAQGFTDVVSILTGDYANAPSFLLDKHTIESGYTAHQRGMSYRSILTTHILVKLAGTKDTLKGELAPVAPVPSISVESI